MVVAPVDVRQIDADSAVVVTIGGIGTGATIPYDKLQTYTLRRDPTGHWRCAAFQNTEMSDRARQTYALDSTRPSGSASAASAAHAASHAESDG